MIELTQAAVAAARSHLAQHPETRGRKLRIWIADKNCDGFVYGVSFDHPVEGDQVLEFGDLEVLLDMGTAQYVGGAVVDFVDDERGRGFLVTHPQADRFRGKFFLKGDAA